MKNKQSFRGNCFKLLLIIILAIILRFYRLGDVPLGLHQDEVSQAYNAFSILTTGRDRYGQVLPMLFRTFGTYQPPVYTYLAVIPIYVFGNTIFAARSVSALLGVLIVWVTYLIVALISKQKYGRKLALVSALVVAISPWAIHFSRRVVEANSGLFFFLLAAYLLLLSLKKVDYFLLACFVLGISTYTYYSEQLISVLFIPAFVIYFRHYFLLYKKLVILGLALFSLILLPHLVTILGGAFFSRFNQVISSGDKSSILAFGEHFMGYFSPKYLFNDSGTDLARIAPGLGVFYSWFFIPFLAGLYFLSQAVDKRFIKYLGISTIIFLLPVSLTGDVFYPLRALEFFWLLSVIISVGIWGIGEKIKQKAVKWSVFITFLGFSLAIFYISYFIFFQHETMEYAGRSYIDLSRELTKYGGYQIVVDSARDPAVGLRLAYFDKYNPGQLQAVLKSQVKTSYYSGQDSDPELYTINNVEVRPIQWGPDTCSYKTIIVGDQLAVSAAQITQHHLQKLFEILGTNKEAVFLGYGTNPEPGCKYKI